MPSRNDERRRQRALSRRLRELGVPEPPPEPPLMAGRLRREKDPVLDRGARRTPQDAPETAEGGE